MASTQPRKNKGKLVVVPKLSSELDENASSSQGEDDPVNKAQKLLAKYNVRRQNSRKAIEDEYERQVKDIKARIDGLFNQRKSKVTKSQKELWLRLHALNKKRQSIESQILASMKVIEMQTNNISREMVATFAGRIEDIEAPSSPED